VGAQLLPEPLVGGLADQVLVELADGRPEPIGVVDGEAAVPVGGLEPVGGDVAAWKHDLQQAGRVDLGQRDPVVADQGDHPGGVRPPGPDPHLVAVQVRPEQAVRLVMLPTDEPLELLALRGDGGHGSSQQLVHASAGWAPAPTGPEPLHDNEYLGEGLDQLEGANPQVPSLPSPSYDRRRGAGSVGDIMARLALFQRRSPKRG
jgi:hypothetical protein